MTTATDLASRDELVEHPCPHWCELPPGHPLDSDEPDGSASRGHQGAMVCLTGSAAGARFDVSSREFWADGLLVEITAPQLERAR